MSASATSCSALNVVIPGSDVTSQGCCPSASAWWLKIELELLHYVTAIVFNSNMEEENITTEYYSRNENLDGSEVWFSISEKVRNNGSSIYPSVSNHQTSKQSRGHQCYIRSNNIISTKQQCYAANISNISTNQHCVPLPSFEQILSLKHRYWQSYSHWHVIYFPLVAHCWLSGSAGK